MTKRIHINQLQPGMYVVGLDKSWWQTPFLSHKWMVRGTNDIAKLRAAGVNAVDIDPTQGDDVEVTVPAVTESLAIASDEMAPAGRLEPSTSRETLPASSPAALQPFLADLTEEMPAARAARIEALAILEGIFEGMKIGKPIDSPAIKHAVSGLLVTILHRPEASFVLTQMQRFEADLLTHSIDVCVLSLVIGKQQSLPQEQLEILGVGAMLHDLGKTRLPRNLLRKSSGYSPQAQKLLNEHPRLGVSLLSHSKDLESEVLRIIVEHHEYADGSGFPEGRTAADLSPLSQLVSIVNLYDGFVSGYSGHVAHLPTQALRRLYKMGQTGQLLSEHVAWTIRTLGVYPMGAVVEFNTGERGLVVATKTDESLKPTVYVVCDAKGQLLTEPRLVNLLAPAADEPVRMITRPLEAKAVPFSLSDYLQDET
jgi:HD-GYP domain-containing protein (c-di-GMP phosphodiesterase class II)